MRRFSEGCDTYMFDIKNVALSSSLSSRESRLHSGSGEPPGIFGASTSKGWPSFLPASVA